MEAQRFRFSMRRMIDVMNVKRILTLLAAVLVVKVTASVVLGYRDYFPPDFGSDFLLGREGYFFGAYWWAFYAHIVSGPITLLLGLALVSERFRQRLPAWHRSLGKAQIALVLFVLTPSGLWMAPYAQSGTIAATGFAVQAFVTGLCALLGWRMAVARRFAEHRRWMWRCFLLLCSAVVIRLIGGMATVAAPAALWVYPLAAWVSWLAPLAAYELAIHIGQLSKLATLPKASQLSLSAFAASSSSSPEMEISARR